MVSSRVTTGSLSWNVEPDGVVLSAGDQLTLTIQMEIGSVGESVTVAGDGSAVRTSPAVSTTIARCVSACEITE